MLRCRCQQPDQYRDVYDSTKEMMTDFREKRQKAEFLLVCIRRLLAFSFLKILLEWVLAKWNFHFYFFVTFCAQTITLSRLVLTIIVICSSQSYMHKYLTNIEHDNAYVTRYYRKIDARRKRNGKHTLLPLKKTEKTKMIDLRSFRLVDRECDYLVGTIPNTCYRFPQLPITLIHSRYDFQNLFQVHISSSRVPGIVRLLYYRFSAVAYSMEWK